MVRSTRSSFRVSVPQLAGRYGARMTPEPWPGWEPRPDSSLLHLDTAAAGRPSTATVDAMAAHLRLEAEIGGYLAQTRAIATLDGLRADLAALLGVPTDGLALTESAATSLAILVRAWRLPRGSRVAVAPSEWGPNLVVIQDHGLTTELLAVEGNGTVDVDALDRRLASDPPAVVHLTELSAHRGLRQPVAAAAAVCRRHGVPLWVDGAQAVGHVVPGGGADAVYGTSRKWLAGPRGVGFLAIREERWPQLHVMPSAPRGRVETSPVRALEPLESNAAGRVGLAHAVRAYLAAGPDAVAERLDEVGRLTREVLADVAGWRVLPGQDAGAITALEPTAGQDVTATRERLVAEHAILTTPSLAWRTPLEQFPPTLRVSPHLDCSAEDLTRLAKVLGTTRAGRESGRPDRRLAFLVWTGSVG